MTPERIAVGDCAVWVLPTIRGLSSEGEVVSKEIARLCPDTVALSISPEELKALREHDGEPMPAMCGTAEENVYESGLSKFGAVERPPRCFISAIDSAKGRDVNVVGVDLSEEDYTRAYVSLVSGWDFVRRALGRGSFERSRFDLSSAEAFVVDWDSRLRKVKGYDQLEMRREAAMATSIKELAARSKTLLAVVELERAAGVAERLRGVREKDTQ
jgi:pheromone shutdown protein TraB